MRALTMLILSGLASAAAQSVKLASVPSALPPDVRQPLLERRAEISAVIRKYNAAIDAFNAKCKGAVPASPNYSSCMNDMKELQSGRPQLDSVKRSFNAEVDAELRRAHLVSSITFGNVQIQGEVHFRGPDGKEIDAARIATLDIPVGTKIVTGPTGSFRADAPGMHTLHVGGGAELTIDTCFVTPSSLQQLALNLSHGFFRWVKNEQAMVQAWKDSVNRFRVRTPTAVAGVRGTDVSFETDSTGAGTIKLYSGEVWVASSDSSSRVTLQPGQMVTIAANGTISKPTPLPAGTKPPPTEPTYTPRRER